MDDDNTTLNNAGPAGQRMADIITEKITDSIDGLPASTPEQRAAIARLIADSLYNYAEDQEEQS